MVFAVGALSAQVNFQSGTTTEIYKKAKSEEKLVFMDLYATWCPPCKAMEANVFSREDVGDFMNDKFVNVKYNIDESMGKELANQYNVSSIPTYLIFTPEGELVGRVTGGMSSETFLFRMYEFLSKGEEKK